MSFSTSRGRNTLISSSSAAGGDHALKLLACLGGQVHASVPGGRGEERIFGVHHMERRLAMPGQPRRTHERGG